MDWIEVAKAAAQLGSMGLLVAYLIYQDQQRAKQRTIDKAERIAVDKETNEERKALTTALVGLTTMIQMRGHV